MYSSGLFSLNLKGRLFEADHPLVMGIVNATPDSFFSGSRTPGAESIRERVAAMRREGADIIDIGGYSSRPGADDVSPDEEYSRLAVALEAVREVWPEAVVSIDTFRASVARRCVEEWGADIINDISGGDLDPGMWPLVADLHVPYVLMHMRGNPSTMQTMTSYEDVVADIMRDLAFKIDGLRQLGVADIIVDPGFGFAKTVDQNFRLLNDLDLFHTLGTPVLAGLSRKTMVWRTLGVTPDESLYGTVALDTVALLNGADIVRVHDVLPAVQTVRLLGRMKEVSLH